MTPIYVQEPLEKERCPECRETPGPDWTTTFDDDGVWHLVLSHPTGNVIERVEHNPFVYVGTFVMLHEEEHRWAVSEPDLRSRYASLDQAPSKRDA